MAKYKKEMQCRLVSVYDGDTKLFERKCPVVKMGRREIKKKKQKTDHGEERIGRLVNFQQFFFFKHRFVKIVKLEFLTLI